MRDLSNKTLTKEMETPASSLMLLIKKFLPNQKAVAPSKFQVVDIGAGLAMYHVLLHHKLRMEKVESVHTILDRSENGVNRSAGKSHAGYRAGGAFPFYSSLECATDIAMASGMDDQHWKTLEASPVSLRSLGEGYADVLMSIVSWMYHYPEEGYLSFAAKLVRPRTGRLIITPKYQEKAKRELLDAGFSKCEFTSRPAGHLICCVGCLSPLTSDLVPSR